MKKVLFIIMLLVFSFSLTSAFSNPTSYEYKEKFTKTEYYPHDAVVVSVTRYAEYENDDRYSTRDYHNGYSYRTTESYWDSQYAKNKRLDTYDYGGSRRGDYDRRDYSRDRYDDSRRRNYYDYGRRYYDDEPSYYREYSPHSGGYKEGECYDSPPRGKLFYIRCP